MHVNPHELDTHNRYKIATGVILPRPIAWVSSQDSAGNLNLAPYSFFTVPSTDPLTLTFCPQRSNTYQAKDTLSNVQQTREFVVNITNEATALAMSKSAAELPHGQSEFAYAEVTPHPSKSIAVPRVAEAPVAFECTLHSIVEIGRGALVIGLVQSIYLQDDVYQDGYIVREVLQPIGRLAGAEYAHINNVFKIERG